MQVYKSNNIQTEVSSNLQKNTSTLYLIQPISCSNVNKEIIRSSPSEVLLWKYVLEVGSKYIGDYPIWKVISTRYYANYWDHTSLWVFSCKFAVCFQNTLSHEHLLRTASEPFWFQVPGNSQLPWWLGLLVFASKFDIYSHIFGRPWYSTYG